MLRNRIQAEPTNAELYYHLGNFAYAHDLEAEGIARWEKAYGRGRQDKVSLDSLYRARKSVRPRKGLRLTGPWPWIKMILTSLRRTPPRSRAKKGL